MDFRRVLFAFLALWGLLHVAADDAIPSTKVATHVSTTSLSQETPASDDEALRAVHPSQQYCPRNEFNHDYDHGVEASIGEEMRHELGEIASWFADHSSSFFLSSKNDIDEARWSNYSDHIHQ